MKLLHTAFLFRLKIIRYSLLITPSQHPSPHLTIHTNQTLNHLSAYLKNQKKRRILTKTVFK